MSTLRIDQTLDREAMLSKSIMVFDIETNGFLDKLDRVHCIAIQEVGRGGPVLFEDTSGLAGCSIKDALVVLENAEVIVAHNGIGFDIPAIQKVYPGWEPKGIVVDSLVLSRLVYPNLFDLDITLGDKCKATKKGSHAIEAWGQRLGELKGDYKKEMEAQGRDPWAEYNDLMGDYCKQDVVVNVKLLEKLINRGCFDNSLAWTMEMRFHTLMEMQQKHGFLLDVPKLQDLNDKLVARRDELLHKLQEQFPPIEPVCLGPYGNQKARAEREVLEFIAGDPHADLELADAWWLVDPLRNHAESKGIKFKWSKRKVFNPNSEKQVAERFMALGWKPKEYTPTGQPKLDEPALIEIGEKFEEGKPLAEFMMLEKRIGQISSGKQAWLKLVDEEGRIHGRVNSMGTVSFRCSHSGPNTGQVPGVSVPYGEDCRACWTVPDGRVLVGTDASGLELRLLGHYLARYDGGAFARECVDGDIHSKNASIVDLERHRAKVFIYAFLYGAGDVKLGSIAGKGRAFGKAMRARFLKGLPALDRVIKGVRQAASKQKKLKAIDGRTLYVRSAHSALNLLIQSAGSILVKLATVLLWEHLESIGMEWGIDYAFVAHVHDEYQIEALAGHEHTIGEAGVWAIEEAGRMLELRCEVTGEAKHGANWAETH